MGASVEDHLPQPAPRPQSKDACDNQPLTGAGNKDAQDARPHSYPPYGTSRKNWAPPPT